MENITRMIPELLNKKLGLYEQLRMVVEAEKAYIVDMDIQGMWSATEEKKRLVAAVETVLSTLREGFAHRISGRDSKKMGISDMVDFMPVSLEEKASLRHIIIRIRALKREISILSRENQRYVTEYLSVISGIFSTITNTNAKKQYGRSGVMMPPQETTRILHAEV
ncbi:MAG: flagellar protein FlgN [Desulfobacter sp.]|nr:MAG: flagellar protein FlgN [Desulfobacter sp.]